MLHPSRPLVMMLALIALAGLVLGLATDVGLFGWSLSVLIVLYVGVVGIARLVRRRPGSTARPV